MENSVPGSSQNSSGTSAIGTHSRSRNTRGRKRKRLSSESSSDADVLPDNAMEVEKSLHASAVKNNLDDVSVKKILKKVVTNDHVLALVKLQEEEEEKASKVENPQPKLTRAKVKELFKVSPKSAPWNLELTPIKHIPVKTRPEVKALISQELHADEDDDEYQPTADDVPSDDDHTLESCSDADSQPRTPATPRRHTSPRVLRDGPFKVPQEISTPRRRLDMDEDATIALRTRSKLSLSSIPIDHIESSFVPPDELPMPVVDDIWSEFLQECMNPETSKNEDDEDDPEYNVAADPDANDEDEEGLENIMKISKKELNDLVTELFNIIPESAAEDVLSGKLANAESAQNNTPTQPIQWEGKQEPGSDEETGKRANLAERRTDRLSLGKCEPLSDTEPQDMEEEPPIETSVTSLVTAAPPAVPKPVTLSMVEGTADGLPGADAPAPLRHLLTTNNKVTVHVDQGVKFRFVTKAATPKRNPVKLSVVEGTAKGQPGADAPPSLRHLLTINSQLTVHVEQGVQMLPEQIQIMQQQLRQHIQLATSNFLQLFVHPVHWALAPTYRDYLEVMDKMAANKPDSVVNVCNLRPAVALIRSWQESVSADTPENAAMVEFVHKEVERARRRAAQNSLYVGNFHETFLKVVSNSPVFLYPYLLPPMPFRSDIAKRFNYLRSEDELITLGIDEFWQYVEDNRDIYKIRTIHTKHRWGLVTAVQLLCKHMLPWMPPKAVLCHMQHVRKSKDKDNPIVKFFDTREVMPVKHELLPFNPNLTLYEQPEHEMPRIWVRHLAKSSRRFHNHYYKRTGLNKVVGSTPTGVPVDMGAAVEPPKKNPLPINFTQEIACNRLNLLPPIAPKPPTHDKYDIQITPGVIPSTTPEVPNLYSVVQTPSGAYLVPLSMITTNSASTPICSLEVKETVASNLPEESNVPVQSASSDHCKCCVLLRSISKERQTLITDFFKDKVRTCPCKEKRTTKYPKVTKKLRLLVNSYKSKGFCAWQGLHYRVKSLTQELKRGEEKSLSSAVQYDLEEIAAVTAFQLKLTMRTAIARNNYMKKKIHTLLSSFKPDEDDLYVLMGNMDKVLEAECVDVYKEFLGFMTPEQADKMGKFLDYFIHECVTDLMKRIEDEVSNRRHKLNILMKLRELLEAKLGPCEICAGLLHVVRKYPKLASYVFSLFPHRKEKVDSPKAEKPETLKPIEQDAAISILPNNPEQVTSEDINDPKTTNLEQDKTTCDDSEVVDKDRELDDTMFDESQPKDYEADNSESDDDGSYENNLTIVEEPDEENSTEIDRNNETLAKNIIDTPHLTVTKTEVGYSETDMSMSVMSGEETVKSEPDEWKRDEDKLLLEILKQSLTPEERKDKTIIEVLEEKNVLQLVADSLSHKSIEDVRQRMIYLLKLIVLNNE